VMQKKLERIIRFEHNNLLKYSRARVSNLNDAEDILQDVYARAVHAMGALDPIDNILGWLYRSLSNRIIDWYRRKKNRTVSLDAELEDSTSLIQLLADSGIDIEMDFIRQQVLQELEKAIDELPELQREVIIRQAIEGQTFQTISDETGVSINTLLARKRYALKTLGKRLEKMKEIIDEIQN